MHSKTLSTTLLMVAVAAATFAAGVVVARPERAAAQDRGPQRPKTGPTPVVPGEPGEPPPPLVFESGAGGAASAGDILAVTGSYGVGTSVLYVIDTKTKQLAVYEARGGSPSASRLFLVGARRIDLDLQLEGYNDDSEFDYRALKRKFDARGAAEAPGSAAEHPIPVGRGR